MLKTVLISTMLMLVLAGPAQASTWQTQVSATSDTETDTNDCFYEANRNKPECR